ncbi:MAG: hypothetical protein IPK63_09520 [Candidatus Competibacteraceae bacterium]|nr:hypothetical protein [Candidatus Competibacteraceae bacterium]
MTGQEERLQALRIKLKAVTGSVRSIYEAIQDHNQAIAQIRQKMRADFPTLEGIRPSNLSQHFSLYFGGKGAAQEAEYKKLLASIQPHEVEIMPLQAELERLEAIQSPLNELIGHCEQWLRDQRRGVAP